MTTRCARAERSGRERVPTVRGFLGVLGAGVVAGVSFLLALAMLLPPPSTVEAPEATSVVASSSDARFAVWDHNADGTPVRWDPCRPIEVVLSRRGAPATAVRDLEAALEYVGEVSGLRLVFSGATEERPSAERSPYQPERYGERWAPVLVAWAEPGEADLPLRDIDRGVSIPVAVGADDDRTYVTGQIVLGAHREDLAGGFGDRAHSWGATLVHALGHLVRLGHVDDPDELIHVVPGRGPVEFGPGDLAGFEAVGSAGGCRPAVEPQPVDVGD